MFERLIRIFIRSNFFSKTTQFFSEISWPEFKSSNRNVGIGTSVVTRDFGQTANVKGSRDALRVDKAVGNHVDSVSIAILAKPESRDKRSGKSRAFQCDASTTPLVVKTNDRGTCCSLLPTHFPTKIEQMSNIQPNVQAISSSTQTTGNLFVLSLVGTSEVFIG